ncbi:hypothetical protein DFR30_0062 [Thiogranum longum]|uniref:Divergent polysaccharide deacetylase family protein n=1 Tax=Thiogranum longum TaxID=1537524 RepID=A0A4R1H8S3_9GAMM|nr:divergent polysaccharide deacetylase family protein [Thiogranum longum]TCK16843.1 hypothetical protein DFR30_0062 [Thiogranum longum]
MTKTTGLWPVLFLWGFFAQQVHAQPPVTSQAVIGIIIDDMGKRLETGRRVLALPGPVACAFLPHASHTRELANQANDHGREVLLHLPMDSVDGRPLDAGAVTLQMTKSEFVGTVLENLQRVPHVIGVNNHMGSLLTRHPGHMRWLMETLQHQGTLFFVDSRTTRATVALQVAEETGVPGIRRNVFLDNSHDKKDIAFQFDRLVALAREQGTALAIGHPYPQTLAVLEQRLPQLAKMGIRLVPVRKLIEQQQEGEKTWQAYWSPSRRDAKNSKPSL